MPKVQVGIKVQVGLKVHTNVGLIKNFHAVIYKRNQHMDIHRIHQVSNIPEDSVANTKLLTHTFCFWANKQYVRLILNAVTAVIDSVWSFDSCPPSSLNF